MIQKCPKCGKWCSAQEQGLLDRTVKGVKEFSSGNFRKKLLKGDSGEKVGKFVDDVFPLVSHGSRMIAAAMAAGASVLKNKYEFHCTNCELSWGTDDENTDRTTEFVREIANNDNPEEGYEALKMLAHSQGALKTRHDDCKKIIENYEKGFLEIEQTQRKFLFLVPEYDAIPESFKVLRLSNIPKNLKFSNTLPLEGVMYVCHPLKPDTYIRLDTYSLELFRDKIREYEKIIECLGAQKIEITDKYGCKITGEESAQESLSGGGTKNGVNGQAEIALSKEEKKYNEILLSIFSESRYEKVRPHLPNENELVWYHHDKDNLKAKCDSRLAGRCYEFKLSVSNKTFGFISENEQEKVSVELGTLAIKGNVSYENIKNSVKKQSEDYTWTFHVTFHREKKSWLDKLFS